MACGSGVTAADDIAANGLEQLAAEARSQARLRELQRSLESAEQRLVQASPRAAGQGS